MNTSTVLKKKGLTEVARQSTLSTKKELRKMTKKQMKAKNSQNRVRVLFNTGTRTFKSAKDYSRAEGKKICRNWQGE